MKKLLKILGIVFVFAFVLTGCATVSDVRNDKTEVIYNGNAAALVGDYLYFGNGFSNDYSTTTDLSDADYKNNAGTAYLARVNLSDIAAMKVSDKDFSPKNVDNVAGEVVAYSKSFMFVLGGQIYYVTPNRNQATEEDSEGNKTVVNHYDYTTIYSSHLNGNKKKKIFSTEGTISNIEVLKFDGKYYLVLLAGSTLTKIDLSNNKSSDIAKNVTSVALPKTYEESRSGSSLDWNGKIYFTGTEDDYTGVFETSISGGENVRKYKSSDLKFIGRENDVVFFTENRGIGTSSFMIDTNKNSNFAGTLLPFYAGAVSDVSAVTARTNGDATSVLGYTFMSNSNLMYVSVVSTTYGVVPSSPKALMIDGASGYKVLFISDSLAYLSTTSGIYYVDLLDTDNGTATAQAIVTLASDSVYSGDLYAFDGTYVYFYAKLQDIETEEDETDESEEEAEVETDENYYLYRAKVSNPENEYQVLGRTKLQTRQIENKK